MTSALISRKLRTLGFEYDEACTYKEDTWPFYWRGEVKPIKPSLIDGDEFAFFPVSAPTRKELDALALEYAKDLSGILISVAD